MNIGQLLPQIVDIVHGEAAQWIRARDWRLSRLGEHPMDESMTLHDNGVRDGEVLVLTTIEPPPAEWIECDPCHVMVADAAASGKAVPRILPVLCCVLFGGCGALALALPGMGAATASRLATGTCVAVAAAVGATVLRRRSDDPLLCVPMSLTAVFYAGAVGYAAVPGGPVASGILLGSAAAFSAAILLQRVTSCGITFLTAIATLSAQIVAVAAVSATWRLEPTASGAALAVLALAIIGFAPRIAMVLNGIGPSASRIDAASCHRTLTGLVVGASIAAALGAATVAAGLTLRDVTFTSAVALVLLFRARTHADTPRRVALVTTAALTVTAGFAAAAVAFSAHSHVVSALAASAGAATVSCLVRPAMTPIVVRTVEIVEYVALAAIVPLACWVGGIYGLARGMNLI